MPYSLPAEPPKRSDFIPDELAAAVLSAPLFGAHPAEMDCVRPEHFHKLEEGLAWQAMCEFDKQGRVLDIEPLAAHLHGLKHPINRESKDGYDWLTFLLNVSNHPLVGPNAALDFEHNAELLADRYRRWKKCYDGWVDSDAAMDLSHPLPPDPALAAARVKPLSVADILNAQVPEPRGPWQGVIPPGLTILGARPKSGKSVLMLQLATALGCGGMHFGERVERMPVLYYTLEDKTRRLQDRMRQMSTPDSATTGFLLTIPPLYDGGVEEVIAMLDRYRLIIIDTIERAMPGRDFTKDSAKYAERLGALQSAALERNASVVGIVHRRKMIGGSNPDPVEDVFGSTQMTTAADCVLCIYPEERQKGKPRRARLLGRSRDSEDVELTMSFDALTLTWQKVEEGEEEAERGREQTIEQEQVLDAIRELGKASSAMVAKLLGENSGNTWKRLQWLWKHGHLSKELIGSTPYYFIPDPAGQGEGTYEQLGQAI